MDAAGDDDQLGSSRRRLPRTSSSEENIAVEKPAASNAALSGTAVDRSSIMIRMRAAMGSKPKPRATPSEKTTMPGAARLEIGLTAAG